MYGGCEVHLTSGPRGCFLGLNKAKIGAYLYRNMGYLGIDKTWLIWLPCWHKISPLDSFDKRVAG
jgi:hypothetical protein